ncbi:MAG TPA: ABC transporter transmembrane domain-containing protein, partial [Nitrospira sp.]|nr:ABC transporter transmembrane domain-containing protein [Nitrospira sp.]
MSSVDRFIRLVRYLKPYRLRLIAAFICSALVAAFSGAYAWLVKPVLDEIFINKNESLLLVLPLALFAVAVLKSAFSYGQNYLMNYVGNQVVTDIRQELFGRMIRLPVKYHDSNTSGRLVSRVINDVTLMANAVAGVLKDVFQQGLTFVVMLGVIFYQNWKLGGMSVIVIPLTVVTMMRMGKRLRSLGKSGQEQMGDMASTLQETLAGIRMVKAYGREAAEAERFKESNKAFFGTTMKAIQVSSLGSSHIEVIGVVGVAVIIWYGGSLVIHGEMTPGAFFSFLAAMFMVFTPLRRLSGSNNTIQQALAAAERVFGVIDLETEESTDRGRLVMQPIARSVVYQDVTFLYEGQAIPALTDIDLVIQAGEMVAIVGSSGSGKTTLANLLPRFYDPTAGRVLIDGVDIQSFTLASLRAQIGIVSQDVVLFDDTV